MEDKKEVTLTLTEADAKALSRPTTRRRKSRKSEDPLLSGGAIEVDRVSADPVPAPAAAQSIPAPVPAPVPAAPIIPVAPAPAPVAAPAAALSATSVVGGANTEPLHVKINAKRTPSTLPLVPVSAHLSGGTTVPKIVPTKKRISAAPAAQTLKKPRFVVGGAASDSALPQKTDTAGNAPVLHAGGGGGKSRKFRERKISITVKPAAATRRMRKNLKQKIDAMPIVHVRKILLRKGVLKPKATTPPDEMLRSMLKDYMLLHAAE